MSAQHQTDKELLREICLGCETSFGFLFARYHLKLYRYISGYIKSRQTAEEIVMDVFLKIWLGRSLMDRVENFDSFLFRVARNKSIDFLRAVARNPSFKDLLWENLSLPETDQADGRLLRMEFESKVREGMALLSEQRKRVFEMSREQEMSHDQIADSLGISRNTVNNHIVEAKRFIRTYLAKNLDVAYLILFWASL